MKKYLLSAISFILHLAAIGLIIYLVWPIGRWYLDQVPAKGIDLWLSASYVSQLLKDFSFRFNGWHDFWYSGVPASQDYPSLYFYLMIPFAKKFGLIPGIQRFAVMGFFIFVAFSYLLYHQLAKNRFLAICLTLATAYSVNLYRSFIWAGGIPFWTTQAFFPMVIFLVVKYRQSQKSQWLALAALAAGLGMMGHPQNFLNVILPAAALIILFYWPTSRSISFKKSLLALVKFASLIFLISLPWAATYLSKNIVGFFKHIFTSLSVQTPLSTGGLESQSQTMSDIEAWTRAQFNQVWDNSNQWLMFLLVASAVIFCLSLFFRKKPLRAALAFVPFGLITVWVIGSVFLLSRGIDLYVMGWYKAFWPTLVGIATLSSFLWGEAKNVFTERKFWQRKPLKLIGWLGVVVINLSLLATGYFYLTPTQEDLLGKLDKFDQFSSAFPEVLNAQTDQEELLALSDQLTPHLMVDNPHDYRLYVIDATVNIWWAALMDVPQTRGYIDPPLTVVEKWGIFWLDAALGPTDAGPKSSLIEDWETPEEVADNNLYFLLDWYGTKYLEGNRLGPTNSLFASNISSEKFIEIDEEIITKGGVVYRYLQDEHWSDESSQILHFYRVRSEKVSPILMATEAVPIMHVGSEEGYDTLSRLLGMMNLGPRRVVLVRGPKYIDDLSFSDLSSFEALILYQYDYHRHGKAWGLIEKYLEKGGQVFVDTGAEVKESDTTKLPKNYPSELPGIFPIKKTVREDMGKQWQPRAVSGSVTKGIDFHQFSLLDFDGGPWNISHPPSESDLREGSEVILRHKGIPVAVEGKVGEGKIVWSGFNLPYHVIRDYNFQEGRFFENLLAELVSLEEKPVLAKGNWQSARQRSINVQGGEGVIFKEQAFPGWKARLGSRSLKIYKAGPSSPGFMYVKIPEDTQGQLKLRYHGDLMAKLYSAVSLLTVIFILDYVLGNKVLLVLIRRISRPIKKQVSGWWEKEDE